MTHDPLELEQLFARQLESPPGSLDEAWAAFVPVARAPVADTTTDRWDDQLAVFSDDLVFNAERSFDEAGERYTVQIARNFMFASSEEGVFPLGAFSVDIDLRADAAVAELIDVRLAVSRRGEGGEYLTRVDERVERWIQEVEACGPFRAARVIEPLRVQIGTVTDF